MARIAHERFVRAGRLLIDRSLGRAWIDDIRLDLPKMEFRLLTYLAARSHQVVARRDLEAHVWQQHLGSNTLSVHVSRLRRRLEPEGGTILTHAEGYELQFDTTPNAAPLRPVGRDEVVT